MLLSSNGLRTTVFPTVDASSILVGSTNGGCGVMAAVSPCHGEGRGSNPPLSAILTHSSMVEQNTHNVKDVGSNPSESTYWNIAQR